MKHILKSRLVQSVAVVSVLGLPLVAPKMAPAEPAAAARAHHAMLDQKIPEVRFNDVAFKDAVDFIRDVTGANIHVNWRAIETAGIAQDTTVNMHLRDVQLRKALGLLLSEAGAGTALTYYLDQGVIEITTKDLADRQMFTKVYPVQDLLMEIPDFTDAPDLSLMSSSTTGSSSGSGGGSSSSGFGGMGSGLSKTTTEKTKTRQERADDLVALIRDTVYPDIWRENGGPASIRYFNGMLVVTAPRSVHEAIGGFAD